MVRLVVWETEEEAEEGLSREAALVGLAAALRAAVADQREDALRDPSGAEGCHSGDVGGAQVSSICVYFAWQEPISDNCYGLILFICFMSCTRVGDACGNNNVRCWWCDQHRPCL